MHSIRLATCLDREAILDIHSRAFPEGEDRIVAEFAAQLLDLETTPKNLSLVAEIGSEVVGHVAFSPVTIDSDKTWSGYILTPLAVSPDHQKSGIGSKLVRQGIEQLSKQGVNVLFVYGDPDYYGRFGFDAAGANLYSPPYELQYPFGWQALMLKPCSLPRTAVKISCVDPLNNPELW